MKNLRHVEVDVIVLYLFILETLRYVATKIITLYKVFGAPYDVVRYFVMTTL